LRKTNHAHVTLLSCLYYATTNTNSMVPPTCAEMEEWERKRTEARQTAAEAERVAAEANEVAAHAVSRAAEVEKEYEAAINWAVLERVFAPLELWGIIAEHSGLVGAWRLREV
jgi:hypothetical protein